MKLLSDAMSFFLAQSAHDGVGCYGFRQGSHHQIGSQIEALSEEGTPPTQS
jgi:hypothetical protein